MKLPEHLAFSFLLAQCGIQQEYGPAGTGLMLIAGCLPDLDGIGFIAGWRFYRTYHRVIGHGLPMTLLGPFLLTLLGFWAFDARPIFTLWCWLQIALLGHLVTDIVFYRWPAQLLWPISSRGFAWGLVEWNDLVPTLLLYGGTMLALAWPAKASAVAIGALVGLLLYLGWRAWQPRPQSGWAAWLTGDWASRTARFWRWLTGDFVT